MWSALDRWWWVSEQWMLCFWSFHSCSQRFFVLLFSIVENASLKRIKCLASNETRCDVTFSHSMDKDNLVQVFTHLYCCHRTPFDHLQKNLNEWIARHQVRCVRRENHHTLTKVREREKERFSSSPSKQRWSNLLNIWYQRSWEGSSPLINENWWWWWTSQIIFMMLSCFRNHHHHHNNQYHHQHRCSHQILSLRMMWKTIWRTPYSSVTTLMQIGAHF